MPLMQTILVKNKTYHSIGAVAKLYRIPKQTLERRIADPNWRFPRPAFLYKGVRYWSEKTLNRYSVKKKPVLLEEVERFGLERPWPPVGEPEVADVIADATADAADDVNGAFNGAHSGVVEPSDDLAELRRRVAGG